MHLSQLLACVLLLTLLALWPSEAKPGSPSKGLRTPLGEMSAASQAESGSQRKRDKTLGGGGINLRGDRSRLLRDTKTRWPNLLSEKPREKPRKKIPKQNSGNNCFGHKLDRIGAYSGLGC